MRLLRLLLPLLCVLSLWQVVEVLSSSCSQRVLSPFAPEISYIGRVLPVSNALQFDWSGIRILINFTGASSMMARFTDNQNAYDIFLDGQLIGILNTTSKQSLYNIVVGLNPSKNYLVTLLKRTEALFGVATFGGVVLNNDYIDDSAPCPQYKDNYNSIERREPARKIEFIGDSISCGYGIDGKVPCTFSAGTENSEQYVIISYPPSLLAPPFSFLFPFLYPLFFSSRSRLPLLFSRHVLAFLETILLFVNPFLFPLVLMAPSFLATYVLSCS